MGLGSGLELYKGLRVRVAARVRVAGSLGLRGRKARAVVAVGEGGDLGVVRGHAQQLRQRHGAEQVVEGLLGAILQLHRLLALGGAHLVRVRVGVRVRVRVGVRLRVRVRVRVQGSFFCLRLRDPTERAASSLSSLR